MTNTSLFHQTVIIASDYLGPTAERFMHRQIINHLAVSPENLDEEDLTKLTDWIKVSLALVTEDLNVVSEFTDRLMALTYRDATLR